METSPTQVTPHRPFWRLADLLRKGVLTLCLLGAAAAVSAREVGIGFIDDGVEQDAAAEAALILAELQALLPRGVTAVPVTFRAGADQRDPSELYAMAVANPDVDYIVATGFLGSQTLYSERRFGKPTYLMRVLDPALSGTPTRDRVRNLKRYTQVNVAVNAFERVNALFGAQRVGILRPPLPESANGGLDAAIVSAARRAGVQDVVFFSLHPDRDVAAQIPAVDVVVLPPVGLPEAELDQVLLALLRKRIPSYAVGGDEMVRRGALISDTLAKDDRVLARRVALDLQLAITRGARTRGVQLLESQKDTTINIDTARALGVDLQFDELTTARLVRNALDEARRLDFLGAVEIAFDRGLGLRDSQLQLESDRASLAQARAALRPQLTAQVSQTQRGDQLPTRETLATLAASQTLYSVNDAASVSVAKLGVEAAELARNQNILDTVSTMASAYFGALEAQAQLESRLRDLTLNRENLALAESRVRSGSGAKSDVYRWQSLIATSESAVQQAYSANLSAQSQLSELLNTRFALPTTLADVTLDQPPFDLLHETIEPYLSSTGRAERLLAGTIERALGGSLEMDTAENTVERSRVQLDAQRRGYYLPELALSANYAHYLDSSRGAGGAVLDGEGDWSASLTATLQLWDSGNRRNRIRQFTAQRDQAVVNLERTRTSLWRNSVVVVDSLIANYRSIAINADAVEAAWRSLQITQDAYRLGSATVTDLLDTQTTFREAQDNANIARYQYLDSLVSYQALLGEMPMLLGGLEQQAWLTAFSERIASARQ
ncbi:MAG: TolC family protein [Pseudomonadota bacterium]